MVALRPDATLATFAQELQARPDLFARHMHAFADLAEPGASSALPSAIREGAALARQLAVVDEAFDARRAPGRGAHTASARPMSDFG